MTKKTADRRLHNVLKEERKIEEETEDTTVLFADLVGSTQYKTLRGMADGLKRTLMHNELVSAVIGLHGGQVIKFIGDEVMATFHSADNALKAAISVNHALKQKKTVPQIETKIGIHCGLISYFRYPTTTVLDPQGTTVDLAARVVSNAKGRQILFTSHVKERLVGPYKIASEAELRLKGLSQPTKVYSLHFEGCEAQIEKPAYMPYLDDATKAILEEAKQALSEKNHAIALKLASKVLKVDPIHPEACYILGASAASGKNKDIENAIAALRTILQHNSLHYRAMYMLGYLLWVKFEQTGDLRHIREAAKLTRECLHLSRTAENEDVYVEYRAQGNLAYYLALLGDENNLKDAIRLCEAAIAFYHGSVIQSYAKLLDTHGFVLMKARRYYEARAQFDKALKLDPDNDYAHAHLAELIRLIKSDGAGQDSTFCRR